MSIKISACPKYRNFSAPLCPQDPERRKRTVRKYDRVCFYLRESGKEGAPERFQGKFTEEMFKQASRPLPETLANLLSLRKERTHTPESFFSSVRNASELTWIYPPSCAKFFNTFIKNVRMTRVKDGRIRQAAHYLICDPEVSRHKQEVTYE